LQIAGVAKLKLLKTFKIVYTEALLTNVEGCFTMQNFTAFISGVGKAVPERRLTNADLEKMVETSDEWISKRVGIKERRIVAEGEWCSHLGARAAKEALAMAGLAADQLDFIIVSTVTPDTVYPSVACLIQAALGATKAGVFDVSAACTGFIYASGVAWSLIRSGMAKHVLVVSSEVLSSTVDWTDRDTCILFGDGAGAAVYSVGDNAAVGVQAVELGGDGAFADLLKLPNSGCRPYPEYAGRFVKMQGNEVFKHAVRNMENCAVAVLNKINATVDDVTLFIPHQANTRIIDAIASRLNVPAEKVFVNIEKYGNTSSASIPIALCEAVEQGRLKTGDLLILDAFGAGLTWGAMAIRWK
jgi:3-oxoacyl-[acyl-carrier-protein] synthase-3